MLKSRLLLVLSLFFISLQARTATSGLILVSDIDDTIQKSQIHWTSNPWGFIRNVADSRDAFVGMPELYRDLADQRIEIQYLTATPQALKRLPSRFLRDSGFPEGLLWTRPSLREKTLDYKVRLLQFLFDENPQARFILVGDNGEKDIEAYDRIRRDPRYGPQVLMTFIHRLYKAPPGSPLKPEQKPYVSSAEITLDLREAGFVSDETCLKILRLVDRGLKSPSLKTRSLTIPEFASFDQEAIDSLRSRAKLENDRGDSREIKELILSIAGQMEQRNSRPSLANDTRPIPLGQPQATTAPVSPNTTLLTHRR